MPTPLRAFVVLRGSSGAYTRCHARGTIELIRGGNMTGSSFLQKMHFKPGYRMLLLNAPDGYLPRIQPLPEGSDLIQVPEGPVDFVHLFVKDKAELDQHAPTAINAVKPGGLLWISYPKRSSKVKTDLTRDIGWDVMSDAGWTGIAQVSIDDTWSATRFRPAEDVGRRS